MIDAVRAPRIINVPVVMTREEEAGLIPLLNGVPQLVVKLLYGSGLRIMEALRLRAHKCLYFDSDESPPTASGKTRFNASGRERSTSSMLEAGLGCAMKPITRFIFAAREQA